MNAHNAQSAPVGAAQPALRNGPGTPSRGDILLVEDHAVFREPIRALLEAEGYSVRAATDGLAAIDALATMTPRLVLLDLSMPSMGGIEVLSHIRGSVLLQHIPVIVMTIKTERDVVVRAARLGVSEFLSKNEFSLDRLMAAVRISLPPSPGDSSRTPGGPASGRRRSAGNPGTPPRAVPSRTPSVHEDRVAIRALVPLMSREETLARLGGGAELKGLSPVVSQILTLTSDARCDIEALASTIERDPAIALRILQLANSSAFSRGASVDSVRRAVIHMGTRRVRDAVLGLGIVERYTGAAFGPFLDSAQFWKHSIACGIIASEIAKVEDPERADSAFVRGLLHDVGRVIMAEQLGDAYVRVIQAARELQAPLECVEARMLSIDHAEALRTAARAWRLPASLLEPMALHHSPQNAIESLRPRLCAATETLIAADRFAHALLLGSSGNETVSPTEHLCRRLRVGADAMGRVLSETRSRTEDMMRIMVPAAAASRKDPAPAQESLAPMRPLIVGSESALDAARLLLSSLADGQKDATPTLTVVRAIDAEAPQLVHDRVLAAEQRVNVRGLPVLILHETNEGGRYASVFSGRAVEALRLPLSIPRLRDILWQLVNSRPAQAA